MHTGGAVNQAPTDQEFIISRTYNVPVDVVYKAWTQADRLKHWFGPRGFSMTRGDMDFRPGGTFLYCLQAADGTKLWGKFVYRDIHPMEQLEFVTCFSDEAGGITRHPMSSTWPLQMLAKVSFSSLGNQTTVTLRWQPIDPTEAEEQTFRGNYEGMRQGWTGTLDQLDDYLATAR